jgi:hypothetical protein
LRPALQIAGGVWTRSTRVLSASRDRRRHSPDDLSTTREYPVWPRLRRNRRQASPDRSTRFPQPSRRQSDRMAADPLHRAAPGRATAGMGVSTLHRHFQELTTMSPLQYQKQHEARRLLSPTKLKPPRSRSGSATRACAVHSRIPTPVWRPAHTGHQGPSR